jgi:hypothetical protein
MKASDKYFEQAADKSRSPIDRKVAWAYAELQDQAAEVARQAQRLAKEAEDVAARWSAVSDEPEVAFKPIVFESAMSDSYDKAVRRFNEKEQALKVLLSVQKVYDQPVD